METKITTTKQIGPKSMEVRLSSGVENIINLEYNLTAAEHGKRIISQGTAHIEIALIDICFPLRQHLWVI